MGVDLSWGDEEQRRRQPSNRNGYIAKQVRQAARNDVVGSYLTSLQRKLGAKDRDDAVGRNEVIRSRREAGSVDDASDENGGCVAAPCFSTEQRRRHGQPSGQPKDEIGHRPVCSPPF